MTLDGLTKKTIFHELGPDSSSTGLELTMHEGAVMVVYALHLLETTDADHITLHPTAKHRRSSVG